MTPGELVMIGYVRGSDLGITGQVVITLQDSARDVLASSTITME